MTVTSEPSRSSDPHLQQGQPQPGGTDFSSQPPGAASSSPRMISGIDLIDYGAGGLYPERVYLLKGGIGTGKTIAGLQFLTRGLELHEPGLMITDQKPESILTQARAVGFNIDEAVKRGQLSILSPSTRYFELVESPADVGAIMEELGDYIQKIGAKRLVIDPIYTLVNTTYSSHFALTVTQSLINALEELPVTTILIAGDEDNPELNPLIRMIEQNSFGVISLAPDLSTGGRLMRLSKLRFASTDHLAAHYRILNGRGLINYRGEGEKVADVTKPWEEATGVNRSVFILGANADTIGKIKEALGNDYSIAAEADLSRGAERIRSEKPGLVLVSPQKSASSIRAIFDLAQNSSSSIAFLSPASNRATDKVLYLRAGADDFITEPFSPAELRARVDALVRRSGRRLNLRDSSLGSISSEEMGSLLETSEPARPRSRQAITTDQKGAHFAPDFGDRLQRNIDTVSKMAMNFVLYWIKSPEKKELNRELARLCRQEDIICLNSNGEFVAILTGTDQNGVTGFETRLEEKIGDHLRAKDVRRGYAVNQPGESTQDFLKRAIETRH